MTIEHASIRVVSKPWGSADLRPWSQLHEDGAAIGELWFERADKAAPPPALLLKLLFTTAPLSIQVHPDDAFARSVGLDHGKTEAWYVLSALSGSEVAIGLTKRLAAPELRSSIEDGSIAGLVQWRVVLKGDLLSIPAGTIHAIGPGLVLAEIQQRSDATYRLFDYGRQRELHVDEGVAVAIAGPAEGQPVARRLSDERTLLIANPYFVLELVDLSPESTWQIDADAETWLLGLDGHAQIGEVTALVGEAVFLESDRAAIKVGPGGFKGLLAYTGPSACLELLQRPDQQATEPGIAAASPLHLHTLVPAGVMEARP